MNKQAIRKQLEAKLTELSARVERIEAGFRRGRAADSEDRAQEDAGNEVRDALAKTEVEEISQIKAALKRIESGTFGACAECGEKIPEKRLLAMPLATTCIECSS